jgi:type IV pilus assembly protein PilW
MLPKCRLEAELKKHERLNRNRARGFSLVEVMVALVIGMFGVLIMMQVLSVSEGQKRSTTGSNDAMNEGVMALYALQSDVRMSGYGITDTKILGCDLVLRPGLTLTGGVAPVTIFPATPAAFPAYFPVPDANTDGLLIFYGSGNGTPQGDPILNVGNIVLTPSIFAANDWVIDAPTTVRPSPCILNLNRVANVVSPAVNISNIFGTTALTKGDTLFNLGQTVRAMGYAVRGGNLTMCDYGDAAKNCTVAGNWDAIANNIVSLRAQYGRDTAAAGVMDGIVDIYDQTTPSVAVTPNTACSWSRISAVRLAIVARSVQYEKTAVTAVAPLWEGAVANNPLGSSGNPIVLSADPNWQNYRYKVFQTVVPIRNVSWMGAGGVVLPQGVPTC